MMTTRKFREFVRSYRNGFGQRPELGEVGPIVLRIADVSSGAIDLSNTRRGRVSPADAETYRLRQGDLLFVRVNGARAIVGRCCVVRQDTPADTVFNDHLIRVELKNGLDPEFARYWMSTPQVRSVIEAAVATSAGQLTINQAILDDIDVPEIEVDQQRRIAARLQAQLAAVEEARVGAERQVADAKALYARFLAANFDGMVDKESISTAALASIGEMVDGDWVESKDQDPFGTIRLTQLADVGDGVFRDRSKRFVNVATAQRLRCTLLQRGDILIARMPDPIGRACIFPGLSHEAITVVDVCILRLNTSLAIPEFVEAWLNSPETRSQLAGLTQGATRARVSTGTLKQLQMPIPPFGEQQRIVADLKLVSADANRTIAAAETQLTDLTLLPSRLLSEAFEEFT